MRVEGEGVTPWEGGEGGGEEEGGSVGEEGEERVGGRINAYQVRLFRCGGG